MIEKISSILYQQIISTRGSLEGAVAHFSASWEQGICLVCAGHLYSLTCYDQIQEPHFAQILPRSANWGMDPYNGNRSSSWSNTRGLASLYCLAIGKLMVQRGETHKIRTDYWLYATSNIYAGQGLSCFWSSNSMQIFGVQLTLFTKSLAFSDLLHTPWLT